MPENPSPCALLYVFRPLPVKFTWTRQRCILLTDIMRVFDFLKSVKSPEQRLAWLVALAADAIQIVALPLFAPGGFSPADTLLDLVVAGTLLRLLGWHWAFLPTFAAELVPGLDLFPTWTAAIFFATRQQIPPRGTRDPPSRSRPRAAK